MKRVLFYIHNGWVFGKIHNELIKALHPDVYCDILCWTKQYTRYEFNFLKEKYDYFVSTPEGCYGLHTNYGIPLEKTVGVLHANWDIFNPLNNGVPKEIFLRLAGYAAISPILQHVSIAYGVERVPDILRVGVFQKNYPKNTSTELKKVGSFSKYARIDQGFDLKRGNLIEKICETTEIELVKNEGVNFLGVEILYKHINLVVIASLTEGNPYPMLEAFACGIPVLGTPTGIAPDYLKLGGGKLLPLNAEDFVKEAVKEVEELKKDKDYYLLRCEESYSIGNEIDWSNLRQDWIRFFNSLD